MFDIDLAIRRARHASGRLIQHAVERHACKVWGESFELSTRRPEHMPPELPDFHVIRAVPTLGSAYRVYLTCGAAAAGPEREREFLLLARDDAPAHVETLAHVAELHSARNSAGIDVGAIVDLGRPWVEGAMASRLFVSRLHRRAPSVGSFHIGHRTVRMLWLRPISELEAGFAHTHGVDALRRRLDRDDIDFTDPHRRHVV